MTAKGALDRDPVHDDLATPSVNDLATPPVIDLAEDATTPVLEITRRATAQLRQVGASIAHDLASPLAAVATALETLRAQRTQLSDDQFDAILAGARDRLNGLAEHISDLMDEVLQGPGTDRAQIDLREVVEWLRGMLPTEERHRLRVELDVEGPVWGHIGALRQIVQNLVSNSLRHNPERPVTVRIATVREPGRIHLEIADDGVGYPDAGTSLFEAGWTSGSTGNTGLGMTAVKARVESLDGSIAVIRSPLGGAAVRITLPVRDESRSARADADRTRG